MTQKLTESDIDQRLGELPEWTKVNEEIQRTFHFDDFVQSMAFVNKVADAAERDQHHPDILIRYNKVTLSLSSHDAGGITEKDFALASYCDSIA